MCIRDRESDIDFSLYGTPLESTTYKFAKSLQRRFGIIEETLEQRYQGVKNEKGVWITPAFPKLIYVLEEDNIHEDSPYYYLTKLAAKCTARRMVPDYISAKKMLELKGDVYTCMGCRSFLTPDRFTDAGIGNIATQIIAQVASNQYGGQSISLAHLAPFVQVSREKIRGQVLAEIAAVGGTPSEEVLSGIVEKRLREEIRRGVQTIQYQVVTLMTTNGQAPFVTVFMYLGEVDDPQTKRDLALIIEETLVQRYEGVKNEEGVWITPAFPKLIYVLEEDNVRPGTPTTI